jgi:hypothetical protein
VIVVTRRRMNFGEVVSMFPGHKKTPSRIAEHFRSFILVLIQDPSSGLHMRMTTTIFPCLTSTISTVMTRTGLPLWR